MFFVTSWLDCKKAFHFFCLNERLLIVELAGVEPASENPSTLVSPITVSYLTFPLLAEN